MTDQPDPHRRRREDALAELAERLEEVAKQERKVRREGSENFRAYRKRARWAFWGLAATNAVALALVLSNLHAGRERSKAARADLARAGAQVVTLGCTADNDLRARIGTFVTLVAPKLGDRAASVFPMRDCASVARPLLNAIGK